MCRTHLSKHTSSGRRSIIRQPRCPSRQHGLAPSLLHQWRPLWLPNLVAAQDFFLWHPPESRRRQSEEPSRGRRAPASFGTALTCGLLLPPGARRISKGENISKTNCTDFARLWACFGPRLSALITRRLRHLSTKSLKYIRLFSSQSMMSEATQSLPRLGSRVRIPSPAPDFLKEIRAL
jgi:hypothetical protein